MKTCVILNGPPGCGKDTIAGVLTGFGFKQAEMKRELYVQTARIFDVDVEELHRRATDRELKEQPWLGKLSPRDMLIHASEEIIKPCHGKDFFGLAAAKHLSNEATFSFGRPFRAVFSDGGFREEIAPLVEKFDSVLIVRLHREGYTFKGDSRSYLVDVPGCDEIVLTVIEGRPDLAAKQIISEVMSIEGWSDA